MVISRVLVVAYLEKRLAPKGREKDLFHLFWIEVGNQHSVVITSESE
jgi:hypothetical protein